MAIGASGPPINPPEDTLMDEKKPIHLEPGCIVEIDGVLYIIELSPLLPIWVLAPLKDR